ncbi:mCG54513, partial [Mus musculus]
GLGLRATWEQISRIIQHRFVMMGRPYV